VAGIYTSFIRSVPDLCLMLLLYYGGQSLVNRIGDATGWWLNLEINQFAAGVLTIGLIFGAYMTETFRGAFASIHKGEIEAAVALGMTASLRFQRIIFPQLIRYALPSLSNNWLVLLKTTALVSILG
jgi:ABC-type arginine transport system permease subunit